MTSSTFRQRIQNILAKGGIVFFFIMAFEVMIMISPFAFFFYMVFNPVFHFLGAFTATRWLVHFFLPHMLMPPTLPLKIIRIFGSVLFVFGAMMFIICALQVYLGKIFKWGIATRGIYRFVRHPQYTSLGIWGAGMAILWPRFIVLFTLSMMFVLYYFLARDEERRMMGLYGDSYKKYMTETGMFFPGFFKNKPNASVSNHVCHTRNIFALTSLVLIVIGAGFACRQITLNSLQFKSKDNVTLVSIMPEDSPTEAVILSALQSHGADFLNKKNDYLGYEMPVDYIMQGMIANTGIKYHLYKQHHTIGLIIDWVFHPFEHLRRSPSAHMAKMKNVEPSMARRHQCPLGIDNQNMDCNNCEYRRVIFVKVENAADKHISQKELFAFNTQRIPVGFIDVNIKTGDIINSVRVRSKTAWSDVPTPAI
jgi:protein-S-isoprenylcysteine O-methyltransferase Ste14